MDGNDRVISQRLRQPLPADAREVFQNLTAQMAQLAAGLAHEIRNPLHAVNLNLHVLQRAADRNRPLEPEEQKLVIDQSVQEIHRIEQLLAQMLAFAAPDPPRPGVIDLTFELQRMVADFQPTLVDQGVQLEVSQPETPIYVEGDATRWWTIVRQLMQNAQQALSGPGKIRIELSDAPWAAMDAADSPRFGGALFSISDSGDGIAPDTQPRIFEPFFTTRAGNAGLGLAMVKRFVQELDGQIQNQSNCWGGATFVIALPCAERLRHSRNKQNEQLTTNSRC